MKASTIARREDYLFKPYRDDYYAYLYQKYKFIGSESKIIDFIQEQDLLPFLLQAPREIQRVFGNNTILELELHFDYEEEWKELFIVIKSPYPAEKAIELERKLFDEWFVHIMDKVNNKLNFTEEPL
jgi:hypothetical protein